MKALQLPQPPPQTATASVGLLLLRVFGGYAMRVHGWGKIRNPFGRMGPDSPIPGVLRALAEPRNSAAAWLGSSGC
jgi:uncharacterized membrane protein YphA (DoxX/SURF4 family)